MPTSPRSDVIPVSRLTKALLLEAKGGETFDALLRELLRAVPPEALRARLDDRRAVDRARVEAARAAPEEPRRTPSKQRLLASAAVAGWERWLATGRVERLGPRRYRWNLDAEPSGEVIRVERRPGRGLPP